MIKNHNLILIVKKFMMKKIFLFVLIISAMVMTACGDGATKKRMQELDSSYDYDGKEVTLTGYLTYNSGTMIMNGKTTPVLRHSNWQKSGFVRPEINFGKEPNNVWIPNKFRLEDIEIYDSSGQKHGINTKCNLKGTVRYTHKDWEKATIVKEETSSKVKTIQIYGTKSAEERAEEAKKAAEERRAKTGDPNDYTFEFIVNEISVVK